FSMPHHVSIIRYTPKATLAPTLDSNRITADSAIPCPPGGSPSARAVAEPTDREPPSTQPRTPCTSHGPATTARAPPAASRSSASEPRLLSPPIRAKQTQANAHARRVATAARNGAPSWSAKTDG